jgi:CspA family cold shock protein
MNKQMKTTGTVKWYNDQKGYGFIQTKSHDSIFVHYSAISEKLKTLREDQEVQFELIEGVKGAQAFNVIGSKND